MNSRKPDDVAEIIAAWNREQPEVDASSIAVLTPLLRLTAQLRITRDATLRQFGIDQGRLSALGALRRSGAPYRLSAGELAQRCRVTAGAITQRLDRLEDAGYVVRRQTAEDHRGVTVELTAHGARELDTIFRAVMRSDEELLSFITARERESLAKLLGKWMDAAELNRTAPD